VKVSNAFGDFDHEISPGGYPRAKAEDRLARFAAVLTMLHGEIRVVPAGSWARGTAIAPIHDVDFILVLPDDLRPRNDAGGRSAEAVLEYVARLVEESAELNDVHRVERRNHVVKWYLDSTVETDDADWHGLAIEIMPAFRDGEALLVPSRRDDRWNTVDPEHLIRASERRQQEWPQYTAMVRMLKAWAREHPELRLSPLAMEVLALRCLPHPPLLGRMSNIEALMRFFTAAAGEILRGVHDPAGRSGEIAPDLDRWKARKAFLEMADLAAAADEWEKSEHPDREDISIHFLRKIFGKRFTRPSRNWDKVDFASFLRPEPEPEEPDGGPVGPDRGPGGGPRPGPHVGVPAGLATDGGGGRGGDTTGSWGSRFRNAAGHRAMLESTAAVAGPAAARAEEDSFSVPSLQASESRADLVRARAVPRRRLGAGRAFLDGLATAFSFGLPLHEPSSAGLTDAAVANVAGAARRVGRAGPVD
jgi:hypothetical protein